MKTVITLESSIQSDIDLKIISTDPVETECGDRVLFLVYNPHGAVQVIAGARRLARPRLAARVHRHRLSASAREHCPDEYFLKKKIKHKYTISNRKFGFGIKFRR